MTKLLFLVFTGLLFLYGCGGNAGVKEAGKQAATSTSVQAKPVVVGNEVSLLLKDLTENGDYVNSNNYPSLIKASIVHEGLDGNQLIIDLRTAEQYKTGHVKGAVSKKFEELPEYFQSGIKPFEYERIVLICDDGQVSSYTACLLRLMGYGNVYAMRWGMSSWNMKFAEAGWLSGLSGKYETQLDVAEHAPPAPNGMPELNTGMPTGEEIGASRFNLLFSQGKDDVLVTSDQVFSDPGKYFVINLERKDKYESGHIPGAVRYKPESTLGFIDQMASIPADKTVVVYCGTGHNSAFATAYLRLFGYDARTLKYGNNSFMYDKMVAQKETLSWLPFSTADVNNYETVK